MLKHCIVLYCIVLYCTVSEAETEAETDEILMELQDLLYKLKESQLHGVFDFLSITCPEGKSRYGMLKLLIKYLTSSTFEETEDGGMSEYLALKDHLNKVIMSTKSEADIDDEVKLKIKQLTEEQQKLKEVFLSKEFALQKEIDQLAGVSDKCTSKVFVKKEPGTAESVGSANSSKSGKSLGNKIDKTALGVSDIPLVFKKELKFTGQIGSPKDASKLSFSSLAHQIENAKKKNYSDQEICEATIKAISPGLNLRSYLEGKTDITLPQLRRILRAHFSGHDATELYTELSSAVQHSSESVQNFVVRLMDMRQKVIFASQESESQLQYDPVLVQKLFLRAISTGLISYSIKADIEPYLNDINVSDEVLLEKLNLAANNEAEQKHKLGKQARVNVFETPEVEQPNKRKSAKENPILNEIKSLRVELNENKYLKADVAMLKETPSQPAVTKPGYQPRKRIGCPNCVKEGKGKECSHCYRCGETGHLKMNCKLQDQENRMRSRQRDGQ